MARYHPDTIRRYVQALLEGCGFPERRAQISSEVLVEADLRGIYSHGINGLDLIIIPSIRAGGTIPSAECTDVTRDPRLCVRHLDAAGAPGHPTSRQAVGLVKRLAREHGMARVFVYGANHFGAAGIYSEEISAEGDLEGRVYCTSSVHAALPGSPRPALGTNPIAWSIPYAGGLVTIDMATTVHAASAVCKAIRDGAGELPFAVFDRNGALTTDPRSFLTVQDFLENGAIPPLGTCLDALMGEMGNAYYKGMGLGILVALVCSTSGSPLTTCTACVHDEKRRVVHLFEASRIDTLLDRDAVLERLAETVRYLRAMGPDLKLPGEIEAAEKARALRDGIPYSGEQIAQLRKLGEQLAPNSTCALTPLP
jgi:L-2-hydroxycarboxylate dehydrogenase (NAD+)